MLNEQRSLRVSSEMASSAAEADPVWQEFHALLSQCMAKFGSAAQSADVVCSTSAWERDYHDSLKVMLQRA